MLRCILSGAQNPSKVRAEGSVVCVEPDTFCPSMSLCACVGESSLMGWGAHRTARTGPAHRDRGGDRLRERLDHVRAAHGVCGTLRQEPLRAAPQGHSRRRDHVGAESEELSRVDSQWVVRLRSFFNVPVMACIRVIRATGT